MADRRHIGPKLKLMTQVPKVYSPDYFHYQFMQLQGFTNKVADSEGGGIPSGFSDVNPSTIVAGAAADPGVETDGWASAEHVHPISTGSAVDISEVFVSSEGTSTALARANHIHASPYVPMWRTYVEFTFTDFSTAALSKSLELLSLPDFSVIYGFILQHDTAFGGGAISAYTVEVGIVGDTTKYTSPFDVFSAPSATNFLSVNSMGQETCGTGTPTSIKITARSVGANLNAAATGMVWVEVLWSAA
jgi:hypothetical protein